MINPFTMINASVLAKKNYSLPKVPHQIKLNQNENPDDLPMAMKTEILAAIQASHWNRYPELGAGEIRRQIAQSLGLSADQVMVGNGSNEIMLAIFMSVLEPGKRMITVAPTFLLYAHYGELLGATVENLPLTDEFQFPVAEIILRSAQPDTALTVLCSPNNPTGTRLPHAALVEILTRANGFVLVDEAYVDFCPQNFIDLLVAYPNLILTRTFSKACAFSFGRFGYGLAQPKFVEQAYKVILPYNLNGFSQIAAAVFLKNRHLLQPMIDRIIAQRDWLFTELTQIKKITAYRSEANFILIRPKMPSKQLFQQLLAEGILVRDVSGYPGLGNHLRISVGKPQENATLVRCLRTILANSD